MAWFLQELPSLLIPVVLLVNYVENTPLFIVHYFQRTLVYPFLMRSGKPTPFHVWVLAVIFCTYNGVIQGLWHLYFAEYPPNWFFKTRTFCGLIMFVCGMFINIHSDAILRSLRAPGDNGYKIPYGGLFEYVSGANYFGECLEWAGYAIFAYTLPAMAFAIFTICNVGPRALHHHRWYLEKFDDYPKNRKAFIMFLL
ncbi:unnamed protein product [Enterobius vermicularis]|uniref:3-oxo-5alpha-steroid 4-dehydrogenase (NADP(+)) n=1 Tax=Enterobius vermicularis TaxID=51028 RepID=A0A0N4VAE6_ENTVE|nr:unnamed protein product [Enterobius vermicularis]